MAMISGARSICKLKQVSTEAVSLLSASLSHMTMKLTLPENPLQTVAEGNLCYQNSRSYHLKPRDGGRASELCKMQWRSLRTVHIVRLADEQITFPEFSANGELLKWEKAKFIAGSALPDPSPSIGFLNVWEGSGEFLAEKGYKVRLQYECYDMSRHIDHETLPHYMTLGQGEHGQGFDEGIYGMRSGGRRRIAIPQMLCATSSHEIRKNKKHFSKFLEKKRDSLHHPEKYKIFDVILLDMDKGL